MRGTHLILLFLVALLVREKEACSDKLKSPFGGKQKSEEDADAVATTNVNPIIAQSLSKTDTPGKGAQNTGVEKPEANAQPDVHAKHGANSNLPTAAAALIIQKLQESKMPGPIAYFVPEKRGDLDKPVFESNVIATRLAYILLDIEPDFKLYDKRYLKLKLSNEKYPADKDRITNVMVPDKDYNDPWSNLHNIVLIKLKDSIEVRHGPMPPFVRENLDWIYDHYDEVKTGKEKQTTSQ